MTLKLPLVIKLRSLGHPSGAAMDSAVESMETKGVKLLTNYALSLVVSGHGKHDVETQRMS